MPGPDLADSLREINTTRSLLEDNTQATGELKVSAAELAGERASLLESGASARAIQDVEKRITRADSRLNDLRRSRGELLATIGDASEGLFELSGETLVATLDGAHPVAMLPVRLETRFITPRRLQIRVFPDQLHLDAHDPALTPDEEEAGRWYWQQRWAAGLDDTDIAESTWQVLVSRFRPPRAAYVVSVLTPENTPADGDPRFPTVATRTQAWSRAPEATALPDRFCVVGLVRDGDTWVERFREWGKAVPDRISVGPSSDFVKPDDDSLPLDDAMTWLHDPERARDQGFLIEVDNDNLVQGVTRLVVLGVDWTQTPEQAAESLGRLIDAQRHAGHFGFVTQGTPTNNTSDTRAGYSSDPVVEADALAPHRTPALGDEWSGGVRLAAALGLPAETFVGVPGADQREHAWASALTDVLWRATGGYYLSEMLHPLADDPQIDADLREFTRRNVFASGPLPTLRVAAQPYGVLPVVSSKRYETGEGHAEDIVQRISVAMRRLLSPAIGTVPHLRRAGEDQDVDATLLHLLQRTPVPWSFRFRSLTGPVQRNYSSTGWEVMGEWQRSWTATLWAQLGEYHSTRLSELTHGKDHALPVPLVVKPDAGASPLAYLSEIAELMGESLGRTALNLREDSTALLEALAACSAVMEMDRAGLGRIRDAIVGRADEISSLAALSALAIPTPDTVRVEPAADVAAHVLDFRSGRQLADAIVPEVHADQPIGRLVPVEFADKWLDLAALLGAPTDPYYWMANQRAALNELATAPPEQLEWAFRGWLDLFCTRLDAWSTGLATKRLTGHREGTPTGVHLGCWGFVEDLTRDTGAAAESVGFVHTPSLAHATSTALLRNGRLANRGADGEVFDLQVTSARVRRAVWLLDGVAQGQSLAALLGYRIERQLRESALEMMRYQLPLRRTAPLAGPDVTPDESVEVLSARDVVDGVALLDRWHADPAAVLTEVRRQAGLDSYPSGDQTRLSEVLDDVFDSYDAVSDVLIAESVHQAAAGNLDRAGAALAAHDRHGRAPDLDYISSPRSGHTVAHRVGIVLQDTAVPVGWRRDARGDAEPQLDTWVARLLGKPSDWQFAAVLKRSGQPDKTLPPVSLADLGLGALSVALATQQPGTGGPSELEQRLALAFAAGIPDPGQDDSLDLLADASGGSPHSGLGALMLVADWVAQVAGSPALTARDLVSTADVSGKETVPGSADLGELATRVGTVRGDLDAAIGSLQGASTPATRFAALLVAAVFDADAVPRVPASHPDAAAVLLAQADDVLARLLTRHTKAADLAAADLPDDPDGVLGRHQDVIRAMLGAAQPVLPMCTLDAPEPAQASKADRASLTRGDGTVTAAWLHRAALVRPALDPLAGVLLHAEGAGADIASQLTLVQLPHRPGAPWLALPFEDSGVPPHGSVGIALHAWKDVSFGQPFAGVLVDAWTETIPAERETTGITFHYDAPGARAPQAMLLAVHPARHPDHWDFDTLLDTVNEAADLAQLRTLSAAELGSLGSFLPALYLPDDYTHDVPSVELSDLVLKARLTPSLLTEVLGKA